MVSRKLLGRSVISSKLCKRRCCSAAKICLPRYAGSPKAVRNDVSSATFKPTRLVLSAIYFILTFGREPLNRTVVGIRQTPLNRRLQQVLKSNDRPRGPVVYLHLCPMLYWTTLNLAAGVKACPDTRSCIRMASS